MKSSSERFSVAFELCKVDNFKGALQEYRAIVSGYPKTMLEFGKNDFIRAHLNAVNVQIKLIKTGFYNNEENFFLYSMSDNKKNQIREKVLDLVYLNHAINDVHHHISRIIYLCTKTHEGVIIDPDRYHKAKYILENLDKILATPSIVEDQSTPLSGDTSSEHSDSDHV